MTNRRTVARVPKLDPVIVDRARDELREMRAAPWFRADRWSVSPHNFDDNSRPPETTPKRITIADLSGRVIEQMAGIGLSTTEKVALAQHLADAGVPEMHTVYGIDLPKMQEHVRAIRDAGVPIKRVGVGATVRQVQVSASAGIELIEVETMGSPNMHAALTGIRVDSVDQLLEGTTNAIRVAKQLGLEVRADINDMGYARIDYMRKFGELMRSEKVDSVQLCDSSSSMSPRAVANAVRLMKSIVGAIPVGVHLHNDFGTASASALAALEAGAEVFDTSVNGIGGKAGQLDLATFALAVEAYYGVESGIRFDRLTAVSRFVEDISRIPVPTYQPVVGLQAFASAVEHIQIPARNVDGFFDQSILPEAVGNRGSFPVGRHTGHFGLLSEADRLGVTLYEDQVDEMVGQLDDWFELHKRPINDEELRAFMVERGARAD